MDVDFEKKNKTSHHAAEEVHAYFAGCGHRGRSLLNLWHIISNLLLFILLPLHMGQVHQFCFLCCLRKGREMHLLQCFQIFDGCAVLCVEFRYFYSVCSFEEFVVLYVQ